MYTQFPFINGTFWLVARKNKNTLEKKIKSQYIIIIIQLWITTSSVIFKIGNQQCYIFYRLLFTVPINNN